MQCKMNAQCETCCFCALWQNIFSLCQERVKAQWNSVASNSLGEVVLN